MGRRRRGQPRAIPTEPPPGESAKEGSLHDVCKHTDRQAHRHGSHQLGAPFAHTRLVTRYVIATKSEMVTFYITYSDVPTVVPV